ncbi:type VI secretion system lipoprotein TssJ [Methylomonas sp. LW13]|uniref:type VI secretion system lipoprotein TssJ n=1 Tax=unclassified Methylomonas TaxID=2608980 RepID=UPI00051C55CD|nr:MULTISPECIES: type VI secretion system lipoprotein TssJ [unclassified Methylomonas]PKD39806.1 type VI secretion system lipoprotein TssJ [Methylomonas sp. Kb3]QBC29423.1 type VI secretion system lipoprotein TssJ [Methylomonas sp. LW13]
MLLARLLPVFFASLLAACAEVPEQPAPPPPTVVELTLNSTASINPDADGKASPVVLRIYELREKSGFNGADFFAIFDKEQATLASDLVRKQELVIKPGENKSLRIEPAADTRVLGFFAAFRKLDNAGWRTLTELKAHQNNAVLLKLDANSLTVTNTPTEPAPAAPKED